MQCAVIEFGRSVIGLEGAHSSEFYKDTPHPVICLLDEQRSVTNLGGTMRLGASRPGLSPAAEPRSAMARRRFPNGTGTDTSLTTYIANNTRRTGCRWLAPVRTEPWWKLWRFPHIPGS